ncbi:aldo/keto reductase [Candidatus Woesebacteria bacterium RIFCSPHIGHO2_01_FULL_39_32]|uniref:Aldo/keto reductase n=1 Tax=Candidatus Woesebacteria bacterium RIFCSPLOWO2_01_FULL_39_25 TaxID=1802521 RepID=A0A1F8BLK1_9BACT|nr:MAG: aldo/keto reductase [Candidatus Woesebacteria bacterium GWB1_37_5]OGM25309.1 MAG: aldo/keto reductase [Candidatus Woesebacteria bacterium RIFCSPHIGHO2_01_FULL_39_32]OGM37808.1 MAG: aldo/keto reductase [Candidatus Woesebacteria bacterium RIFCSPHIGHO2_12_FULL_38_11]OGM64840.1 MAG: aldo/keto reductase [Candidatus Woesebacteria bacterium RIFCSPLOWO2_01_FULL_39_25]
MKYRILGKTGLKISEVGMGTWQLAGQPWGWDPPDEKESLRALYRFVELGGNFIDTAWVYGRTTAYKKLGLHSSEELIGEFLKESKLRDNVIIATKIPPKNRKWPAWKGIPISKVFPDRYIERYVDSSLRNLKADTIDLMQFHVWQDDFAKEEGWKKTIEKITKSGKVKFWGISINDYQPSNCIKTLDTGLIQTIQLIFNIFHQKPIKKLFPYAKKQNIGLIVRVPLDEGGLTGRLTLNSKFKDPMRSIYFRKDRLIKVVERVKKLEKLLNGEAKTIPELALRFVLSFSEISSVIPGTRKVKYVEANTSVSDGRNLSRELINGLKKHSWERNFYVDHDPSMKASRYVEV